MFVIYIISDTFVNHLNTYCVYNCIKVKIFTFVIFSDNPLFHLKKIFLLKYLIEI